MAIASHRFSSLNKDTNIALADFNKSGNGVLNKITTGALGVNINKIETAVGINVANDAFKVKGSSLPGRLANLVKPDKVLDSITSSLSSVGGVTNALSGKTTLDLYNSTLKTYSRFGGNQSPTVLRNKVKKGIHFGKFLEEECKGDIENLLTALSRLGVNLIAPMDADALLAMLLALLARLICNDITNSFTSLLGLVTGVDMQTKFGARAIGLSTVLKNPNLLIEVAGSSVGPLVKNLVPGLTGVALTSMFGYSNADKRTADTFFTTFNGALTTLDPTWKGINGVSSGVHSGGNNLGGYAVKMLKNSIAPSGSSINMAVGLSNSISDPIAGLRKLSTRF